MQKVTIKTERLLLQPLTMRHLSGVIRYGMDESNAQMMVNLPFRSKEEVAMYIVDIMRDGDSDTPHQLGFAVMLGDENIGMVDAYFDQPDAIELGWIIDKRYWGNGYAVEAARGLITVFREALGIRRFFALCDSENRASVRVMEKLGMHADGISGGRFNRRNIGERKEMRYVIDYND
ncbi:MAG: GNAT family N-acetyltransferase [Firmicutes bacterium]|nr:GNAT family N-acetyltransferase [Bacillota bacterium]